MAQESEPWELVEQLKRKYASLSNYSYNLNIYFQSITKSSGKSYSSSVLTGQRSNQDSIRDFIIIKNNHLACLFANHYLSFIDTIDQRIYSKKIEPPYSDLTKGQMPRLLYTPFVYRNNIFAKDKWVVRPLDEENGNQILELTRYFDTGSGSEKHANGDTKQKLTIEMSKTDMLIKTICDTIYFDPNPQVWIYKFSEYKNISSEMLDSILVEQINKFSKFDSDSTILNFNKVFRR